MKFVLLFLLIQALNLPLVVLGWVLCFAGYGSIPWLWRNDDDKALILRMGAWQRYVYLAWRNPVANLRHVPGVSKIGRPLFYRTWTIAGREFYFKAGWMTDGYPALSTGAGRGY